MTTDETQEKSSEQEPRAKSDENMWAVFCHLGGLFGAIIPPGNVIVPLIIWIIQRDKYPFVEDQGKEAINFQISVAIYAIACAILIFVAIGFFMLIALAIFNLVVTVMAAVKASEGIKYRYPMSIRLI